MARRTHTLYIDEDIWQRFRQLVRIREGGSSASGKIEDYMKAYINECESRTDADLETSTADYEALKKKHIKLAAEADKLEKRLEKTGEFDNLADIARKLGLDIEAFGNVAELAPAMLEEWHASFAWILKLEAVQQEVYLASHFVFA